MMLTKPRIGLLGLTLELYETLAPNLRTSREQWVRESILPALTPLADVCFKEAVYTASDIDAAVREFEAEPVDALLVICLSYSPSQLALPTLARTRLPVVIWNTQELFSVNDHFSDVQMIDNHGVHGTQDLCNVLNQHSVPFEYVTSHLTDPDALAELDVFFAAAASVNALKQLRLGLMGYPFPGMGDFACNTTHLAATLGCQWQALSVDDYIARAASAELNLVNELVSQYRDQYELASDLTEEDLQQTACSELAMRSILVDNRVDAFSYQFMSFGEDVRTVTLPFVAASRLMAGGYGFAGEGDLVGATGVWLLNRLAGPASLSEIFTIDFEHNGLFMSHMGEMNVAMARQDIKPRLQARVSQITPTLGRQLAIVCSLEPGEATLFALSLGENQQWRFVVSLMRIDDWGPLPELQTPHFRLLPGAGVGAGGVRDFLTAYAKAGGPHHNAICFGDAREKLRVVARLLGAEYCEV